ncbi:MAG: hypothetical protein ACRCYO_13595 [Bacteroidia bacterium]
MNLFSNESAENFRPIRFHDYLYLMRLKWFFLLVVTVLFAFRPGVPVLTATIATTAKEMTTDPLGNVYLAQNDELNKYDASGNLVRNYSDKTFGTISSIDATNPLRILVFNRDFARIAFLDNTLTANGDPVRLEMLGFANASLAASSHDNGLWIYDPLNYELIRFDRNLAIERRTGNLAQLIGIDLHPDFMMQQENYLLLNDPNRGVFLFDIFGTYIKMLPITAMHSMQIKQEKLIYFKAPQLRSLHLQTLEESVYEFPQDSSILQARIEQVGVFVMKAGKVELYTK